MWEHQEEIIKGITYQELAGRIGRFDRHNKPHAHGMGKVLGQMGHNLLDLEGEWRERIPHIQSLVVSKSGADKDLPAEGLKEFWPDYPNMSRRERKNKVQVEYQKIVAFGSRWNDVLAKLGIPEVNNQTESPPARNYGRGGEPEWECAECHQQIYRSDP